MNEEATNANATGSRERRALAAPGLSPALEAPISDRSYKTIVSFKYALKGEAMHQKIRGRWQAASSLSLACVLLFRPRCRSALKIPAWNPWEPRRTRLNAYNPSLAQWGPPPGPLGPHLRVSLWLSTLDTYSFFLFVRVSLLGFFFLFLD